MRAAVLAPYYDLDEVAAHVGYRPIPFMRERLALRRRLLAGGEAGAGDQLGPFSEPVRKLVREAQARGGDDFAEPNAGGTR